jgi:hypothetical protein
VGTFPTPVPGLVIRYAYLWRSEHREGREEGVKDRPCAVVLTTMTEDGDTLVTVLPITHSPPRDPALAVEIPAATKARLGLDDQRSWVIVEEANRFIWPGPDLRPLKHGEASTVAYGLLPKALFLEIREKLIVALRAKRGAIVPRSN